MRKRYQKVFLKETYEQVKEIPKDYELITNSQDIEAVGKSTGMPDVQEFKSLFVKKKDGDIKEVYGVNSVAPKDWESVTKVY
jgi:mannose-1-phosphate guanylyltransferase